MNHTYAVIMAGGAGTRLWPISRKQHPKHLLPLLGKNSLFQETLDRLKDFIPMERVFVVTTEEQVQNLRNQAPILPVDNYFIEPIPRGTASVVCLAAAALAERDPDAVMIVLPSDHYIRNPGLFHKVMDGAVQIARSDYLVTLGITPNFPATGYGYIKRGSVLPQFIGIPAYRVLHFIEKPDNKKASKMLAGGDHYWNSGIFIWKTNVILSEFSRQMPELKLTTDHIGAARDDLERNKILRSLWPLLKQETIDFGIMEHADNVAVLPADGMDWNDVGAWDSLFDILAPNEDGNVVINTDLMSLETKNSLIYSSDNKLIVTIGVSDLIIIDSGDALLVCSRDQAQKVRQIIANLKTSKKDEYL